MKRSEFAAVRRRRSTALLSAATIASAFLLGSQSHSAHADIAYTFGTNQYGELGDGQAAGAATSQYSSGTPVLVNVLDSRVTVLGAGGAHSLVADNGALYAFGLDNGGQLGNNTNTGTAPNPNPLPGLVLTNGITSLQAGIYFSMALANGAVYTWGPNSDDDLGSSSNNNGEADVPTLTANPILSSGVTAIAAGGAGGFAVQNGALYAWGLNSAGQTGNGTFDPDVYVPTPTALPVMTSGVTSISASINHSIGVMNGHAYAWGFNQNGQLGIGGNTGPSTGSIYATPTAVVGLPAGIPVSIVAAGGDHSLALVRGVVYAWGANNTGQLGNGTTSRISAANQVPTAVNTSSGFIVDVMGGTASSYALAADGTIWSWGDNAYGELGNGTNGSDNASNTIFNTPQHLIAPAGYVYTGIGAGVSSVHVIATIGVAPSSWAQDSSGNWNDAANWTLGVPNSVDAPVLFTAPPITATRTITTTTPITVGNLSFTSPISYIIQGTGSITVQANLASSVRGAAINDYVGNQTVAPATLEFATSSNLNVSYGTILTLGAPAGNVVLDSNVAVTETGYGNVAFTSLVSLQSGASLNLTAPTTINSLSLGSNASTNVIAHSFYTNNLLTLGSLSLSSTSKLDIANNETIVHGGNITAITASLSTGYNGGAWNGSGIVSTTAASDTSHLTAVGSLKATSAMMVGGQSLLAGDVLLKYTYYGDADLSGAVDGTDYSRIDSGYLTQATGWNNGDFNYDGAINGSDYTLIDNAFNRQGAQLNAQLASATAQVAASASAVPEPTSLALLGIGAASLLGRRRRR